MRDARQEFRLPGATADTPGTATGTCLPEVVAGWELVAVQLSGTWAATVVIQGRLAPGLDMATIASVSANGITAIPFPVYDLQITVSAYTSGTIVAWYAGLKPQL